MTRFLPAAFLGLALFLPAAGELAPGVEIRAVGEPAADIADRRLKAERLFIGGREYQLYPERD